MLRTGYGQPAGNNGYVSLNKIAQDTFYQGWFDRSLVGSEYRALSDAVTRRGHWSKKLQQISSAIDGLGKAGRRDIRQMRAVRGALEAYGGHGYLRRSIRNGKTSQLDFDAVLGKLDNYIGDQRERRRYVRNAAIRTAAAATILSGALNQTGGRTSVEYDADREALRLLNSRPVAGYVSGEAQPDTEILEQVERDVSAYESHRAPARIPQRAAVPKQVRKHVAAILNASRGRNLAEDMSGQLPEGRGAYQDDAHDRDIFNSGMKTRPLTDQSTRAEAKMRLAVEAHRLGHEYSAEEYSLEAMMLDPDIDICAGDTNGDGIIDGKDALLPDLIKANIVKSDRFLAKAKGQLEEGDRIGAYVTTHQALRYNRDSRIEVDAVRSRCGIIEVALGDVAAYGDKLLDDGDIAYDMVLIRPGDFGTYKTSLQGSLGQTGAHAGKLLNDTGRTVHKSVNTVVGVADGAVGTVLNVTEAALGKLGQLIGLNRGVNYDAIFSDKQVALDERTQSGYGSYKTYVAVKGGAGEFAGDVWTIGNGAVNTAGGIVLIAYNGAVRAPVEGIGSLVGREKGFRAAHDLAGLGQIPICVVIDNVPGFGNNEPMKAQSYAVTELAEGLYLFAPTYSNMMDRNGDGSVDLGEFVGSLPIIQGLLAPYDSESTITERVIRVLPNAWAAERIYDHYRHDDKKPVPEPKPCEEADRRGGGPVKELGTGGGGGGRTTGSPVK